MRRYGNAKRWLPQRMPKVQQTQWKEQGSEKVHVKDGQTRLKLAAMNKRKTMVRESKECRKTV